MAVATNVTCPRSADDCKAAGSILQALRSLRMAYLQYGLSSSPIWHASRAARAVQDELLGKQHDIDRKV